MARVTVEDCTEILENRFELAVLAAQRARNIAAGSPIAVERDNDKNPIIALREIAENKIDINVIKQNAASGFTGSQTISKDISDDDDVSETTDLGIEELQTYEVEENFDDSINTEIDDEFTDMSFDDNIEEE